MNVQTSGMALVAPSLVAALVIRVGLSAIRASPTRDGVHDLDLFASTGVLNKVPDVDDAISAGAGALEAGEGKAEELA